MKLLVGLGNPGRDYVKTRHNIGFMVVSFLARKLGISFSKRICLSRLAEGEIEGTKIILAKPMTFMNLSGKAVSALLQKYQPPLKDLIIIYDDLDLPLGSIRLRPKGGSGGHKGLESIISALNSQEFPRLRIGIGRPQNQEVINYVLSPFSSEERQIVDQIVIPKAAESLICFVKEGLEAAMNKFNRPD